jgi:hypothetical protein
MARDGQNYRSANFTKDVVEGVGAGGQPAIRTHPLNKHEGVTCTTNSRFWPIPMP